MNQKINKYTSGKLEKRNTPKIGDSSNNDRAGAQKCSIKKSVLRKFHNITGKYVLQSLS